jgi:hypothetical protein
LAFKKVIPHANNTAKFINNIKSRDIACINRLALKFYHFEDSWVVFKNLYVHPAYNQQHQLAVAEQVAELIESANGTKLLVVNNITKFFKESKNKMESANILKRVIGILSKTCTKNKVALVCTGDAKEYHPDQSVAYI